MNFEDRLFSLYRYLAKQPWMQWPLDRALAPFNPFNPDRYTDPYPLYRQARVEAPIFYNRLAQTWIVTGYREATDVLRGPVSSDRRRTFQPISPYNKMKQVNIDLLLSNMLMSDDPDHGRLRKLVNRAFTPRAMAGLKPRIDELTAELLAELPTYRLDGRPGDAGGGPVDVMEGLANRLPIYVIGELLGIPRSRRDELKTLSDIVAKFVDPFNTFDPVEMDTAIDELRTMFDVIATDRALDPQNDLITALVQAEADGQRLTREELISMVVLLLVAGHETTTSFIGNSLVALARNQNARWMLKRRPELVPNAVEELLRYDTPIQATDRTALESFSVGGKTIEKGSLILLLFGAANRDPARYANPDELQLDRPDPRPISFGHGPHHCIGAALSRMEAAAVIPAFINAFPDYHLEEMGLAWKQSTTFRGPKRLPITLGGPRTGLRVTGTKQSALTDS